MTFNSNLVAGAIFACSLFFRAFIIFFTESAHIVECVLLFCYPSRQCIMLLSICNSGERVHFVPENMRFFCKYKKRDSLSNKLCLRFLGNKSGMMAEVKSKLVWCGRSIVLLFVELWTIFESSIRFIFYITRGNVSPCLRFYSKRLLVLGTRFVN